MTAAPSSPPLPAGDDAAQAGPLWRRIARALSDEIGPRGRGPGERLPTEAQLAQRFGVNRHTVRRALEQMAQGGLIRVERGRGAFVADDVLDYRVAPRVRFSEWIRRENREPGGQVLHVREQAAAAAAAAALGLATGAPVVVLERLGLADGVPISLTAHHFDPQRLPGIAAALRSEPGVSAALARVGVGDYVRRSTRVSARLPTSAEARLLRVDRRRPLLVCDHFNVDREGRPVEYGFARYPASRVQVVCEP